MTNHEKLDGYMAKCRMMGINVPFEFIKIIGDQVLLNTRVEAWIPDYTAQEYAELGRHVSPVPQFVTGTNAPGTVHNGQILKQRFEQMFTNLADPVITIKDFQRIYPDWVYDKSTYAEKEETVASPLRNKDKINNSLKLRAYTRWQYVCESKVPFQFIRLPSGDIILDTSPETEMPYAVTESYKQFESGGVDLLDHTDRPDANDETIRVLIKQVINGILGDKVDARIGIKELEELFPYFSYEEADYIGDIKAVDSLIKIP